jgi:hypothetical protein
MSRSYHHAPRGEERRYAVRRTGEGEEPVRASIRSRSEALGIVPHHRLSHSHEFEGEKRVTLAALIAAVREADDGNGLVGTLPVAGRTLIERQARLAVRAGATQIVVLIERVPGQLTGAIDRLRRDGVQVEVARSVGDAADRLHPDERVLVFADGALPGEAVIARLSGGPAPALLTIGEDGTQGPFERIDATTHWAGVALVTGDMLRKTVAMLGDWDLQSTLLRRAVGASARRVDVADGAGLGAAEPVMLVRSRAGAVAATQAGLDRDAGAAGGWPARLLYGPIARLAMGVMLDRPIESRWLRWGAIAASIVAIPALWWGWLLIGLVLLAAGAMMESLGRTMASARLSPASDEDRTAVIRAAVCGLALLAFAAHRAILYPPTDWTPVILALGTVASIAALSREGGLLRRLVQADPPGWAADGDALVLLFAPFAAAGLTLPGLVALAGYAALSFAVVQRQLVRLARH